MTPILSSMLSDPILLACIAGLAVMLAMVGTGVYMAWKMNRGD